MQPSISRKGLGQPDTNEQEQHADHQGGRQEVQAQSPDGGERAPGRGHVPGKGPVASAPYPPAAHPLGPLPFRKDPLLGLLPDYDGYL